MLEGSQSIQQSHSVEINNLKTEFEIKLKTAESTIRALESDKNSLQLNVDSLRKENQMIRDSEAGLN